MFPARAEGEGCVCVRRYGVVQVQWSEPEGEGFIDTVQESIA